MEFRLNANAIVTNSKGEVLAIRLKKGPFAGGLSIPGGGINPGELSFDTARREILEETGIELSGKPEAFGFCELINRQMDRHRVVLLLKASAEGTPKESDEGASKWMSVESIELDKKLIPFARESLKIWKSGEKHFTLLEEECRLK